MKQLDNVQVKYWLDEIKSSEERKRKELMGRNSYPEIIKYYEGEPMRTLTPTSGDKIQRQAYLNDAFPNFNSLRAELMYQNPDIICTATKPEAINAKGQTVNVEDNELIMKSALTYAFNKVDALTENGVALFDMVFAGLCFVEVNHISEKPPETAPEQPEGLITKLVDGVKQAFSTKEYEEQLSKEAPEPEEPYSTQETYIRRWNPLDAGMDYRAERVKDIRYTYKIIRLPYAEFIAKYPTYENKVKAGDFLPYSMHTDDKYKKTVVYYEIQVKKKGNKYENIVIAPSYPFEEIDIFDRPYVTNGFNIKIGVLDDYGVLYPKSRAAITKPNHDEKVDYLTHIKEVAERNIPKRGYIKGHLDPAAEAALNSKVVNQNVPVSNKGNMNSIWPIPATNVSIENKEMMMMLERQTEKLWGVSASRLQGKGDADFMGELEIQEAGFQERRIDIQEGLRKLIRAELGTLKDIIVTFWDDAHFFKITGSGKPSWYVPEIDPQTGMVLNPLTDILTGDYECDVDISSALKPNKERRKKEIIEYLTWLVQTVYPVLLMPQGYIINIDEIKKSAKEFGFNPENLIIASQIPPTGPETAPGGVLPPEGTPNATLSVPL